MSVIYKLSHKVLKNQCLWISWKNKNETTISYYSWLNQRLVVYKNERPYKHKIKRYRFRYHPLESPKFPSSPPPSQAVRINAPPLESKKKGIEVQCHRLNLLNFPRLPLPLKLYVSMSSMLPPSYQCSTPFEVNNFKRFHLCGGVKVKCYPTTHSAGES